MEKDNIEDSQRRRFLKYGLLAGGATLAGLGLHKKLSADTIPDTGKKVKVMTADGKLMEVDSVHMHHKMESLVSNAQAREGIEGKKFVMVIDLARCANARKCVEGCQKMHHKAAPVEWIKVKKMQDAADTAPYWMAQPCFHCDNPPCTKVCPVDATFKRKDGVVLIDNERCIGCRFCMAACPYNAGLSTGVKTGVYQKTRLRRLAHLVNRFVHILPLKQACRIKWARYQNVISVLTWPGNPSYLTV